MQVSQHTGQAWNFSRNLAPPRVFETSPSAASTTIRNLSQTARVLSNYTP